MSLNQARQPRGVPVGGQFSSTARAETGTTLATTPAWGRVDLRPGARTPWGSADAISDLGPGAVSVGTPSHGGIKLSPERNRAVPAPLRSSSGWYEEDAEVHIVAMVHPDLGIEDVDRATAAVKDWFPDGWEKATGAVIAPGESHTKDERLWREAHVGDMVVVSANLCDDDPTLVKVTATLGGMRDAASWDGQRDYLVPRDEYRARTGPGFVIDPERHQDITQARPPKPPKTVLPRFHGVDLTGLPPAATQRATKALAGRWRDDDGSVRTLRNVIETEGLSGKHSSVNDGKRTYYLSTKTHAEDSGYGVYPVPKAVFDAVDAPDTRTPQDRALEERQLADHAVERARQNAGWAEIRKAEARAREARAAHQATLTKQ